jgi:hypothetical protein
MRALRLRLFGLMQKEAAPQCAPEPPRRAWPAVPEARLPPVL